MKGGWRYFWAGVAVTIAVILAMGMITANGGY